MGKLPAKLSCLSSSQLTFLQKVKCGYFETLPASKMRKRRVYFWNCAENYLYLCYLKKFFNEMNDAKLAKKMKFFTRIAKLIPTRTSHRIKSHHQKLLMKYKSLKIAIDQLELLIYQELKKSPQQYKQITRISKNVDTFLEQQKVYIDSLYRYHKEALKESEIIKTESTLKQQAFQEMQNILTNQVKAQEESQDIYKYFLPSNMLHSSQLIQCKFQEN